jgi:predicted Fe-Mo cluster-binding NifX family protein
MRIAIPSSGEKIESMVSDKLGRCRYIITFDTENERYFAIPNPGVLLKDGSGIKTVEVIINTGASTLLSKQVGTKAYSVLMKEHIDVHLLSSISSVQDAIKKFLKN